MSKLILDTHIALWWLADDARLTPRLRQLIGRSTDVYVSSASTWEVAIKLAIGKLKLEFEPHTTFPSVCEAQGFRLIPVDHDDVWALLELPGARADPCDRLIAATARRRGWAVVTADPVFDDLGVTTAEP